MDARRVYASHAAAIWSVVILAPVVVLGVGLVADPVLFWDHYLWVDIVGPTVVDAQGWGGTCWTPPGNVFGGHAEVAQITTTASGDRVYSCPAGETLATTDYTVKAEITYAAVLAVILYGLWVQLFRKREVPTDSWFVVALLPLIVFGPVVRVLEDARVFEKPTGGAGIFSYLFISPFEYMFIGLIAIAALLFGITLRNVRDRTTRGERVTLVACAVAFVAFGIAFVGNAFQGEFLVRPSDAWEIGAAFLGVASYAFLDARNVRQEVAATFAIGLPVLAPAVGLVVLWSGAPWNGAPPAVNVRMGATILVLALGVTALVGAVGWLARRNLPELAPFVVPVNLAIVFGQMIDGFSTFMTLCSDPTSTVCRGATVFGVSAGAYGEKHPVAGQLLQYLDGWGFPLAKLALVLVVIVLLEREAKQGNSADRQLVGLIQMAIFVLGFGPGLRDFLLVTFNFGGG